MENNERVIEHKIKIDDTLEISLKIPEKLDIIEFTSILGKARQIVRLGEIKVNSPRNKPSYDESKLLAEYEKAGSPSGRVAIQERYKFGNMQALQGKIWHIRKKLGNNPRGK